MGKKKLLRFKEILEFDNVVQAATDLVAGRKHEYYGKWAEKFFGNHSPLVLELGCGKGEYTTGLAEMNPAINFIGVDIKGSRMWKGAKYAFDNNLTNVAFLRTRVEFISLFFAMDEVSEIWLTFPDPQIKKARKRLTSSLFLNRYRRFLKSGGLVHLKTDSRGLYDYTLSVIRSNKLELLEAETDIYSSGRVSDTLSIKTYYEQQFLETGKPITYLKFRIDSGNEIHEPYEERQ